VQADKYLNRGWRGVYNSKAGWTHAYDSLKAVYEDCKRLGVTFIVGKSGTALSILVADNGTAYGILAEDETRHVADKVILACGAWLDSIIDSRGQSLAKRWAFCATFK
jgi:glycine/D-amino acid oxidase-like deaminating enzyme